MRVKVEHISIAVVIATIIVCVFAVAKSYVANAKDCGNATYIIEITTSTDEENGMITHQTEKYCFTNIPIKKTSLEA